ncbi:MAG: hypothetical protein Aurels2KO_01240 [Aureliella sp.]
MRHKSHSARASVRSNCLLALVFFAVVPISLAHAEEGEKPASKKIASTIRVAKLLWKVNAKSAAKSLTDAIEQAVERGELAELKKPLSALGPQAAEALRQASGEDAIEDPRVAVALSLKFIAGDNDAWDAANNMLLSISDTAQRQLVVRVALATEPDKTLKAIKKMLADPSANDPPWRSIVLREAISANPSAGSKLAIDGWSRLSPSTQLEVIEPMTLTPASMLILLDAIQAGTIPKTLVNMNQLRKWSSMRSTGDVARINAAVQKIWGAIRLDENAAREKLVASTLKKIRSGATGSEASGKVIFKRLCSQCHRLGGEGFEVGPDITSNGRGNLQQLVSNVLDPSLVIGEAFQAVNLMTVEGNVASGILVSDTEDFVRLKLQGGKVTEFARDDIDELQKAKRSLMPEGLEGQTTDQELLDLFAFLSIIRLPNGQEQIIPGVPESFIKP